MSTEPEQHPIPDRLPTQDSQSGSLHMNLIDLDHLADQTLYDNVLQNEVLELFHQQLLTARSTIEAMNMENRRELAHCLLGAARAVGAFPFADTIEVLNAEPLNRAIIARVLGQIDSLIPHVQLLMKPQSVAKG